MRGHFPQQRIVRWLDFPGRATEHRLKGDDVEQGVALRGNGQRVKWFELSAAHVDWVVHILDLQKRRRLALCFFVRKKRLKPRHDLPNRLLKGAWLHSFGARKAHTVSVAENVIEPAIAAKPLGDSQEKPSASCDVSADRPREIFARFFEPACSEPLRFPVSEININRETRLAAAALLAIFADIVAVIAGPAIDVELGENAIACRIGDQLQRLFHNFVFGLLGFVRRGLRFLLGLDTKLDKAREKIVLLKVDQVIVAAEQLEGSGLDPPDRDQGRGVINGGRFACKKLGCDRVGKCVPNWRTAFDNVDANVRGVAARLILSADGENIAGR